MSSLYSLKYGATYPIMPCKLSGKGDFPKYIESISKLSFLTLTSPASECKQPAAHPQYVNRVRASTGGDHPTSSGWTPDQFVCSHTKLLQLFLHRCCSVAREQLLPTQPAGGLNCCTPHSGVAQFTHSVTSVTYH